MYAKFRDFLNYYVDFAGYTTTMFFSVISKNKLSRRELNRQIYDSVEIFDKPFDKSREIVNHVEPRRYELSFCNITMIKLVFRCVVQ